MHIILGAMNRGMTMLASGSTILAEKIEAYVSTTQTIAENIAIKNAEHKTAELALKRRKLDMADTAKKEEQAASKVAAKSKIALEFIQHIAVEKREAFIMEFLRDNFK